MKTARLIHLYLGCIFAPLLLFFVATGFAQVFHLHESDQDGGYNAPPALVTLAEVHLHQRIVTAAGKGPKSVGFQWFVALMAGGLTVTTILGIVMAFRFSQRPATVWACLITGTLVPMLLLWLGGGPVK